MKIRLVHPAIGEFSFPLSPGRPVILGRAGTDVDVELNWDVRVSRRHARLTLVEGEVFIEDLGSRNGTWRGPQRLSGLVRVEKHHGVLIGETVMTLPNEDALELFLDDETQSGLEPSPLEVAEPADREPAYVATMDLRLHTADLTARPTPAPARVEVAAPAVGAPPPPPGPAITARPAESAHLPRLPVGQFVSPDRVEVKVSGPTELKLVWREHLSKGGLFIETTDMRPLYHRLEVAVISPGGTLSFSAVVVHACDAARATALGVPPGLGLQVNDISAAHKAAVQAYADGLTATLEVRAAPPRSPSSSEVDGAFLLAKRLLERLEKNDVYGALEVPPEAVDTVVRDRVALIAGQISAATRSAPANKAARLEAALLALGRLSHALGDPMRRLEHDLRSGHVRAEQRLAAAKSGQGPSISELRRVWQQVAPDKVDRAAFLTRKAFTAKQRGDLEEAIRSAEAALAENPFFDELRPTLVSWQRQRADQDRLDGPSVQRTARARR